MEKKKNLFLRFCSILLLLIKEDLVKVKYGQQIKKSNLVQILKILSSKNFSGAVYWHVLSLIMIRQSKSHNHPILSNISLFILTLQIQATQLHDGHHLNSDKSNSMRYLSYQILCCTWRMTLRKKKDFFIWQSFFLTSQILKEDKDA